MKHLYILLICCMIPALTIRGFAQFTETTSLFQSGYHFSERQIESISQSVTAAVLARLDESIQNQILREKRPSLRIELPFPESGGRVLYLERFHILTPHAKTVAGTDNGDRELSIRQHFVTYHGYIEGEESSLVSLSVSPLGVIGVINSAGENYIIARLEEHPEFNRGDYIIFQESHVKPARNFFCDSDLMQAPAQVEEMMASIRPGVFNPETSTLLECEMALETDYETYLRFNSVENTTFYMLSLMSVVSAIYIRDLNVKITISYTHVWDTVNDPYDGTTSSQLLSQFRTYWINNMQLVHRDLAHYISTREGNLGGVAAAIGGLCQNLGNGYAFSNTNGIFSGIPVYSWDVDVASHETGHIFGSYHTHSCIWNPPIDTCVVTSENSPCASTPVPRLGTIMSYCHLSGSKTLNFHPQPIGAMRAYAENSSCITADSTALELALPNGGEFYTMTSPLTIIWGSNNATTVDLYFSPDSGVTWDLMAANIPAEDRNYVWTIPSMPTTNQALVRIVNSANPAEADTSDAPFTVKAILLQFNLLSPPHPSSFTITPGDTTAINFLWRSAGTLSGITYRTEISYVGPGIPTAQFLANNGGTDTTASIPANVFDSLLTAWNAWSGNDSVWTRWVVRAYYDGDSLRSVNLHFIYFKQGATGILQTLSNGIPRQFALLQNYPNPFNPSTAIRYDLPNSVKVVLKIYNIHGQEIKTLVNEDQPPGEKLAVWDGRDNHGRSVSSGIYIYRVQAGGYLQSRKMILLR